MFTKSLGDKMVLDAVIPGCVFLICSHACIVCNWPKWSIPVRYKDAQVRDMFTTSWVYTSGWKHSQHHICYCFGLYVILLTKHTLPTKVLLLYTFPHPHWCATSNIYCSVINLLWCSWCACFPFLFWFLWFGSCLFRKHSWREFLHMDTPPCWSS